MKYYSSHELLLESGKVLRFVGMRRKMSPFRLSLLTSRLCYLNSDNVLCSILWNETQYQVNQYFHVGSQVSSLLVHPDRCECICGGCEGIRVWNLTTREHIKQLLGYCFVLIGRCDISVTVMCWLFNGTVLAVGTHDGYIHFYDPSESY